MDDISRSHRISFRSDAESTVEVQDNKLRNSSFDNVDTHSRGLVHVNQILV